MKEILLTLLAILCLCMAGSDGPLFPWINILAGFVFMFVVIKAEKHFNQMSLNTSS